MTTPFTVLIGSLGRPTLKDTLDSIARQQRIPGDQCIVTIDSFEQGDRLDVQALVRSYGDGFLAASHHARDERAPDGFHCWGTAQINYALEHLPITGSHIFTLGDDDVFVDGAYARLRPIVWDDPLRPVLYRFVAPWRQVLWDVPRMQVGCISGCCIAAPKPFVGPHPTRNMNGDPYPEHDFDWMQAILRAAPCDPLWLDDVLVIARPEPRRDGVTHRPLWRCWNCQAWRFGEDMPMTTSYCPGCGVVRDLTPVRSNWAQASEASA